MSSALSAEKITVVLALNLVASWRDLSATRRRDLGSALSKVARLTGLPASTIAITPAALRASFLGRSGAMHGLSDSRMRNILSALRYILGRAGVIEPAGTKLAESWSALLGCLDHRRRAALIALARFCTLRQITPEQLDNHVLDLFEVHLHDRTLTTNPRKLVGQARGCWNRACRQISGWPPRSLPVRRDQGRWTLPLDAFPDSFKADLARFGERLGRTILDDPFDDEPDETDDPEQPPSPRPKKPLRPSTVELRRTHGRWAASALVTTGLPIAEVVSLAALVTPVTRARQILLFFRDRYRGEPSAAGTHVGEVLAMVAKYHAKLSLEEVKKIGGWAAAVRLKYSGMTDKNEAQIRAMRDRSREAKLLHLPDALMAAARQLLAEQPDKANSLALRALAIGILIRTPLRLANLAGLRLDEHLKRNDPARGLFAYVDIPPRATKNNRPLRMPLSPQVAN